MNPMAIFCIILLAISSLLIIGIVFFSILKWIKRTYYPTWKFPDYASVGYVEYLFHKYIKRDLQAWRDKQ
nr:hypothetical protein [Mucilaginibacter sp. FT3.2]MBB6230136.1 hypothetical protein [Mucilaginibacter sp. FT3.2]